MAITLAQATIISQLDYSNSILPSLPASILAKQARSHHSFVQNTSMSSHPTPNKNKVLTVFCETLHGLRPVTFPTTSVTIPCSASCQTTVALFLE